MSATAERILDAAGRVFLARGVHTADMGAIAAEAGCSRATLYRWFDNRRTLRVAYLHREARRIGARVLAETAHITDPAEHMTESMLVALRLIRGEPVLAAWFTPEDSGVTARLAGHSDAIAGIAGAMMDTPEPGPEARWLVRIALSLLTHPAGDLDDERELVRRFVVPPVLASLEDAGAA